LKGGGGKKRRTPRWRRQRKSQTQRDQQNRKLLFKYSWELLNSRTERCLQWERKNKKWGMKGKRDRKGG